MRSINILIKRFIKILKNFTTAAVFVLIIASTNAGGQTSSADEEFKLRCGWFENPTPANYWLYDRDDEWIFGVQGGYQLDDFAFPKFKKGQWVEGPNGSYGYGCACFEVRVDEESKYVLEVKKSYSKPLSACRKDKALKKKWNFSL